MALSDRRLVKNEHLGIGLFKADVWYILIYFGVKSSQLRVLLIYFTLSLHFKKRK